MAATLSSKCSASSVDDYLNLDVLDKAMQVRSCNLIRSTMEDYDSSDAPSKVKDNELFYTAKITMVRAHFKYLQFLLFRDSCEKQ